MDTLTIRLSTGTNRAINADNRTALRQINVIQGETYSVTLQPTGGETLTGISNFSFSLRQRFDSENLVEVNSITSGVFTLPLTSVLLNNALVGHDYRQFRAYIQYTGAGEAEIYDPFFARIATAESGIQLAGYVSSFNGQTGAVTYSAGAAATGALTGVFYPLTGNPAGYITTGQTGSFGNQALSNVVFQTGNQTISGIKTFSAGIFASSISSPNSFATINFDEAYFYDFNLTQYSLNWDLRQLYDPNGQVSADWNTRSLVGDWGLVHNTGNETVSGTKTFSGPFRVTYSGFTILEVDSLGVLAFYDRNNNGIYDTVSNTFNNSHGQTIDINNFLLLDSNESPSLNWDTHTLTGDWQTNTIPTASGHVVNLGFITGVTGGRNVQMSITIDAGTSTISSGQKGYFRVPRAMQVNGWEIIANTSGTVAIDLSRTGFANYPPVNSVVGGAYPTLINQLTNSTGSVSLWQNTWAKGDYIGATVNSGVSGVSRVTVNILGLAS